MATTKRTAHHAPYRPERRTLIVLLLALGTLMLLGTPPRAEAHWPAQPATCNAIALAKAREVPPATHREVRLYRAACLRAAKRHAAAHCRLGHPLPLVGRIPTKETTRGASLHQRRNVTVALNVARKMRAPYGHYVEVIAAAMQEQGLGNYPKGHGTSVGFLQLIDIHGTVAWRMNVVNSAGWNLRGARQLDPHGRIPPGRLAQLVQGSAHPTLYYQWVPKARTIVATYLRPCTRLRPAG